MQGKFFKCECRCGVIHVEYEPEWGLEIAMFSCDASRSVWNRIRLAWSALRGRPYTDMVILNDKQLADFAEYLYEAQNHDIN